VLDAAVLPELLAVVRSEHDGSLVGEAALTQEIKQPGDLLVREDDVFTVEAGNTAALVRVRPVLAGAQPADAAKRFWKSLSS
jgi:hypothetical protein